ncbi:hypothetical protein AMATHDRAFT_152540 [Amanita thiersii Skay4041]|uniref:Uncharacterized protein n=1 Tax=Amanita thiersii Skay4041 TaxID=703135 RepID=A0A2A9NHS8_9AGAR|nr:hypothetical protein AMATHDRAFT_152540 [Amanita thiersii Skay4041]
MLSSLALGLSATLLGATSVLATGGFPPVTSPPGACGPTPADASCTAVFLACVASVTDRADPLKTEQCVAAASCYPQNVDAFLGGLYCRLQGPSGTFPRSVSIPRISDEVYGRIAVRGEFISLESYTNWYKRVATEANPNVTAVVDPAFIKESFDIIAAWTGFCSTGNIPKSNFLDWFQYSSTVSGPATSCGTVNNCPKTFNPYSQDLLVACANDPNAVSNPFSIRTCVAGALNWEGGINSFLQAVTCRYNIIHSTNLPAPTGTGVPALSFNLPVSNPPPYTQQNFVDFTYGTLSSIGPGVRFPSIVDFVTHRWAIIVAWTNFCNTGAVPQANLSDFLRYSASALTSTSCVTGPICNPDPNASCQQLFQSCIKASNILTDPYSNLHCALAASCWGGGVIGFGNAISCALNTQGRGANPRFYPRLSQSIFDSMAGGDSTISQQNYIDSFYGALSTLTSPIWPDVNYVIERWTRIKTWANFPDGNVPYQNFADFLQYS